MRLQATPLRIAVLVCVAVALLAFCRRETYDPPQYPGISYFLPHDYKNTGKKYPLIVFSHGFMGCPKQSGFLTRGLAKRGFIVVAPRHRDATCGNDEANKFAASLVNWPLVQKDRASFFRPQDWNDTTNKNRRDDLVYTIDHVLSDPDVAPHIDAGKIGVMGHSFGGYTALGLAGARESWRDTRVKAALVLTPYVAPYFPEKNFAAIRIPVMYQAGSEDLLTPAWMVRTAYHLHENKAPRHYVEIKDAGHLDWMDLGKKEPRRAIISYAKAFFNQYLNGETALPLDISAEKRVFYADSGTAE